MKKIVLLVCVFFAVNAYAGVRMLGESGGGRLPNSSSSYQPSGDGYTISGIAHRNDTVYELPQFSDNRQDMSAENCENSGYTLKECPSGYDPVMACPENKNYYRDCCPQGYTHTAEECLARGLKPSRANCLGFVACQAQ